MPGKKQAVLIELLSRQKVQQPEAQGLHVPGYYKRPGTTPARRFGDPDVRGGEAFGPAAERSMIVDAMPESATSQEMAAFHAAAADAALGRSNIMPALAAIGAGTDGGDGSDAADSAPHATAVSAPVRPSAASSALPSGHDRRGTRSAAPGPDAGESAGSIPAAEAVRPSRRDRETAEPERERRPSARPQEATPVAERRIASTATPASSSPAAVPAGARAATSGLSIATRSPASPAPAEPARPRRADPFDDDNPIDTSDEPAIPAAWANAPGIGGGFHDDEEDRHDTPVRSSRDGRDSHEGRGIRDPLDSREPRADRSGTRRPGMLATPPAPAAPEGSAPRREPRSPESDTGPGSSAGAPLMTFGGSAVAGTGRPARPDQRNGPSTTGSHAARSPVHPDGAPPATAPAVVVVTSRSRADAAAIPAASQSGSSVSPAGSPSPTAGSGVAAAAATTAFRAAMTGGIGASTSDSTATRPARPEARPARSADSSFPPSVSPFADSPPRSRTVIRDDESFAEADADPESVPEADRLDNPGPDTPRPDGLREYVNPDPAWRRRRQPEGDFRFEVGDGRVTVVLNYPLAGVASTCMVLLCGMCFLIGRMMGPPAGTATPNPTPGKPAAPGSPAAPAAPTGPRIPGPTSLTDSGPVDPRALAAVGDIRSPAGGGSVVTVPPIGPVDPVPPLPGTTVRPGEPRPDVQPPPAGGGVSASPDMRARRDKDEVLAESPARVAGHWYVILMTAPDTPAGFAALDAARTWLEEGCGFEATIEAVYSRRLSLVSAQGFPEGTDPAAVSLRGRAEGLVREFASGRRNHAVVCDLSGARLAAFPW